MNRTNKILMGTVLGITVAYALLSFGYTALNILETSEFSICLFNPLELANDSLSSAYVTLESLLPAAVWNGYSSLTSYYFDPLTGYLELKYLAVIFTSVGFALTLIGSFSGRSRDLKGPISDPQEFLFTHRPKSFIRCIAMPWNAFASAWSHRKIPVIIPILFLPFMIPFALMMDVGLIILFAVSKGIMGMRIRSASAKDRRSYESTARYAICPKCKKKFRQPRAKCKCGLVIDYPVPDRHGVKYHTCNKGHMVPCTNLNGARSKLGTVCPYCENDIECHEAKPISISMVGPTGSGKTTLMLSAVEGICETAKNKSMTAEIATSGISVNAQRAKSVTPPTIHGELDSECMFIRSRDMPEKEIMFNDISGSEFEPDADKNLFEEYYRYNDGIVFTIDPLSVMAIHNSQSPAKGSKSTPQNAFESFYQMFIEINGHGPSVRSDVLFAAVITKTDNPRVISALAEEKTPEAFLVRYGQENFVKILKSTFTNVRYFETASLGKNVTAIDPVRWILEETDPDLKERLF